MWDGLYESVRAALQLAIAEGASIRIVLRSEIRIVRSLEGIPYEISPGPDGRERVFLRIAEDTEQIVLVERIARVMSAA